MYYPETWSNWDSNGLADVWKVPDGLELNVRFYDTRLKQFVEGLQWDNLERLGEKSLDGEYFRFTARVNDCLFDLEFGAEGDSFTYCIRPKEAYPRYRVLISLSLRWNARGRIGFTGGQLTAEVNGKNFTFDTVAEKDTDTRLNTASSGFVLQASSPLYVRCNHAKTVDEMEQSLRAKKEQWLSQAVKSHGLAGDSLQALVAGMVWNTLYEPGRDRYVTPVTRRWCDMKVMPHFGNYVLFAWDTFFGALLAGMQDQDFAERQVQSILEEFDNGCIPHSGSQVHIRSERSQPPVGSYCVLKLYRRFGNRAFLETSYETLAKWNAWWFRNRDGNQNGLLEWGCNRSEEWPLDAKWRRGDAKDESGLDNSPIHDDIAYNAETDTMEMDYIELNALYALDCRCLARIADILGKEEEAKGFRREYDRMAETMNRCLWNEKMGIYCSLKWDGTFLDTVTPGNLFPILAGIADERKTRRMIDEWLCNPEKFYGPYMLPAVTRDHPAYKDNDYWRGRVWGPMNFLVVEGLREAGYHALAHEIALKGVKMFRAGWEKSRHIYENYNAETGAGDDVTNSDPVYTWGGLLPYIYLQELMDVDLDGGLRIGSLFDEEAGIDRFAALGHTFAVNTAGGLQVSMDGRPFLDSGFPVMITGLQFDGGQLSLHVYAKQQGEITLYIPKGITCLRVNEKDREISGGTVSIPVETGVSERVTYSAPAARNA